MALTLTADDILERVDELEPNYYDEDTKLDWLLQIELIAWQEIFLTSDGHEDLQAPEKMDGGTKLLIGQPYGRDIYENWLKAKIAENNGENGRYNTAMIRFNSAYQLFGNWWNRTHRALAPYRLRL